MKALERLYARRYPAQGLITPEQARELALISHGMGRQVGLLLNRHGRPHWVIVGTPSGVYIPDLSKVRRGPGRLRGLSLLHTHLGADPLTQEDLMDLLFLRLDAMAVLTVDPEGAPRTLQLAHLLPPNPENKAYEVLPPAPYHRLDVDLAALVEALEDELERTGKPLPVAGGGGGAAPGAAGVERAVLVSVATAPRPVQEASLAELAELCRTAGLDVAGSMVQRVHQVNPATILGKGKFADLEVLALQGNAGHIVFDQELTPAQMRNLAALTERKVLDRTQLILDIFAQHANTKAGRLQVELAQLAYTLPRLVGKGLHLSRLMGGIGGRGPGESKLEMDRRRIKERMTFLRKELKELRKRRGATRARRAQANLPVVALVGYTNAGKSTLLNTLTSSKVLAENKLFATLDPTTRRLRFPREREIILTDTVGFIRQLPDELKEAFRATLEELEAADLLVHVADAGHPELDAQIMAVDDILRELSLDEKPRLLVLNKWDSLGEEDRVLVGNAHPGGLPASALERATLEPLVAAILERAFPGVSVNSAFTAAEDDDLPLQ